MIPRSLEESGAARPDKKSSLAGQGKHSMRIKTRSNPANVRVWAVVIAAVLGSGRSTKAASEPPRLGDLLAGKTLSAVIYVQRSLPASRASALNRFMLQAYLRRDGSALVRVWDAAHNAYSRPVERKWDLSGDALCLDIGLEPGKICANIHVWGPRIAGVGTTPYVLLDGDLKPGNAVLGTS
jgi:hypothetical protein